MADTPEVLLRTGVRTSRSLAPDSLSLTRDTDAFVTWLPVCLVGGHSLLS